VVDPKVVEELKRKVKKPKKDVVEVDWIRGIRRQRECGEANHRKNTRPKLDPVFSPFRTRNLLLNN
jgi:hypothetical protein